MRTERQKQAARVNGAKSRGPNTPEGKLASSRNAIVHGLLAATIVLEGESTERFHALVASFLEEMQPQTVVETSLVENMAVTRWRQMRVWGLEKAGMDYEMRRQAEASPSFNTIAEGETRAAIAFRALSDESRSLDLINRYESRYDRQYLRAHRRFLELVDRRTPPSAPPPKPPSPPPDPVPPPSPVGSQGTPGPPAEGEKLATCNVGPQSAFLPNDPNKSLKTEDHREKSGLFIGRTRTLFLWSEPQK